MLTIMLFNPPPMEKKSEELKQVQFEQKLNRIRQAQIHSAEMVVMQGLVDKGLMSQEEFDNLTQ